MVLSNVGWAVPTLSLSIPLVIVVSPFRGGRRVLLCLSSPVAYNSKLSPAKVSQPQLLTAQRPQRGEPFGRAPRSSGCCNRSAYIPAVWHPHNHLGYSIPSPVKFTWHGQTLHRYLWGTIPFPVETNCPHRERQPPFYTTVGHILVPGEFHEDKCGA